MHPEIKYPWERFKNNKIGMEKVKTSSRILESSIM